MPRLKAANLAQTSLAAECSANATSITVQSSQGFPNPPFRIFLGTTTDFEIMEVTEVNGTTWTVLRAQEGTIAKTWPAGTKIENRFTAGSFAELISGPSSATPGNLAIFADSSGRTLADGGPPLTLGETANTAYRGDRGKAAYDHSQDVTGLVHGATTVGANIFRLPNPNTTAFIKINPDNTVSARSASDFLEDLGATTVGRAFFTLANPSAVSFPRINEDNTVTARSATDFLTDLGATTVGKSFFTLPNPSAIRFPRINADNTVTARSAEELLTDLGATTVGRALLTLPNPSAVTFLRINADNSVSALSASAFLTAIGAVPLSGGTMTGILVAYNNTNYTTAQVRNIVLSTSDPSGGGNGDVWIKYNQ